MDLNDGRHHALQRDQEDPFGDHAQRSSSSSSSSVNQAKTTSTPFELEPAYPHHAARQSSSSIALGQADICNDQDIQTPSNNSVRSIPVVASSSGQSPPNFSRKRQQSSTDLQQRSSASSKNNDKGRGKGKVPETLSGHSDVGLARDSTVLQVSSSSAGVANVGLIETHQSDAPPLFLNEKTAAEAAESLNPKVIKRGQRKVWIQKQLLTAFDFSANFILIFASWYWPQHYYIYLPFISLPLVLNCIMIFMIVIYSIKNLISKPEKIIPPTPETMVFLMPCYNESFEECTRSLDSLTSQVKIDQNKKAIMIVCDGKVRGPGMEKTTAQYLAEDILAGPQTQRFMIRAAYLAWDGQSMDVECLKGSYKGVPFFCINKQHNQGKRDSLIVSRSFVYNFNRRAQRPRVVFSPTFFEVMAEWLQNDAGFERVDLLIGMDADTVFDEDCISHLVDESHYPHTVGVCGYVAVDFQHGKWNLWSIYQSAEYTIAQALRRLHQSLVTHKVSCLPGCCQLLKVCTETCGDRILIDLFGYHPKPMDGIIRRIRATASEDRNHVCLMLMESPRAQTRQALRARAYTEVPRSTRVFLSQRRRWTLGATSNDLMLFTTAPLWRFNWWERIVAFSNVLTWLLNPFVIASLGCMIYAFLHQPWWIIVAFASIMIIPILYYLTMVVWMPRNTIERLQFMLGLSIFTICGPFINIMVTVYAIVNMDNFGWGKTRKVVGETGEAEETNADEERTRTEAALRNNEKVVGSQIPNEENRITREATPYTAEPPRLRGNNSLDETRSRRIVDQPAPWNAANTTFPNLGEQGRRYTPRRQHEFVPVSEHVAVGANQTAQELSRPPMGSGSSRSAENLGSFERPFDVEPLVLNKARYSHHSLNFRAEDFRSR